MHKKNETPRAHAQFGPSGLKSLELCPGFRNHGKTSAKADRGERLHKAVETGSDIGVSDPEELRQVDLARRYFAKATRNFKDTHAVDEILVPICEQPDGTHLTFGYPDRLVFHDEDKCDIFDWKFGEWAVPDASVNPQGIAYAVGVFEQYPGVEEVTVHFVQPPLGRATSATFGRSEYDAMRLRVEGIIAAAKADDPKTYSPNKDTCQFCVRNGGGCEAMNQQAAKLLKDYDQSLKIDVSKWPTTHSSHADPAALAEMMQAASILKAWADNVRHNATTAAANGATVPGYKLTERRGSVEITSAQAASAVLVAATSGAVDVTDVLTCCKLDVGSLMSLLADRHPGDKAAGKQAQADATKALAAAGLLVEGDPTIFLRKSAKTS
jgi:hypothetical protein